MAAAVVAGAVFLGLSLSKFDGGEPKGRHRWAFLDDAGSPEVLGFYVNTKRAGAWTIEDDTAATGARSLVNRTGEDDAPPSMLVASAVNARDLHATTRCRVSADRTAGACGLVFRHVDSRTHHVARLEPASGRVVLGRILGGAEHVLGSADAQLSMGSWHELKVNARGDTIRVMCDGKVLIDVHDVVPSPHGGVGLWVPSRGEAFFDELAIEVFAATPQVLEVLPLLKGRSS